MRTGELVQRLQWATHPSLYAAQLSGEGPLTVDDALRHYLDHGAHRGLRVCALFSPDWYAAVLADRGVDAPTRPTELFFHWLTVGWAQRIVPTPLFDAEWYSRRHPGLAAELERTCRWSFEHYLTAGCYQLSWVPSPLGRHHPGGGAEQDPATGHPLLLRELLHRAEEFDLARTSWLEEGQRAALRRLASLESPRMRELVARAAALEPAVRHTKQTQFITVPPYRTRRLFLAQQAEAVRRAVGVSHADVVVLVATFDDPLGAGMAKLAPTLAEGGSWLVVATDRPSASAAAGERHFDLSSHAEGLAPEQRVDLVVDLVRGLTPRRVVVAGSADGRRAIETFGRQLGALFELGRLVGDTEVEWAVAP